MIRVIDNFCPAYEQALSTFEASGFGSWTPSSHMVGSGKYDGMSFMGDHHVLLYALGMHMGAPILPQTMFARKTDSTMERGYIHSDRASGAFTCVVYLNDPGEESGTAFYRHRETGLQEMPIEWMADKQRAQEMVEGKKEVWEQTDFVRGLVNRAVIFNAPLFHSKVPLNGTTKGRVVWVTHFHIPQQ